MGIIFRKIDDLKKKRIEDAILQGEKKTSCEIRVHLSMMPWEWNALHKTKQLFFKLGMENTKDRNAILIFFNPSARRFALYGDIRIHEVLGQKSWDDLALQVKTEIKGSSDWVRGIEVAIRALSEKLATHFPPSTENPNEISNQVTTD